MAQDISRHLHQPNRNYVAARFQQAQKVLDSDFNEGALLLEEGHQQTVADTIGRSGSADAGFSIGAPFDPEQGRVAQTPRLVPGDLIAQREVSINGNPRDVYPITVRAGVFYLGGRRLTLPQAEEFVFQRDYLQLRDPDIPADAPDTAFRHLYYLHAWEQCVTAVEDDEIAEPMLRGWDSSVRIRTMRRVEVFDDLSADVASTDDAFQALYGTLNDNNGDFDPTTGELRSAGRLQLTLSSGDVADPSDGSGPTGERYLGAENIALRILLTTSNTFVWSKSNGAPLFRVKVSGFSTGQDFRVEMLTPPRDQNHLPLTGRVVELIPFAALLEGGTLPPGRLHPHARKVAAQPGTTLVPPEDGVFVGDTIFTRVIDPYNPTSREFGIDTTTVGQALVDLTQQWSDEHPDAALLNLGTEQDDVRYMYMRLWHTAATQADVEIATTAQLPLGDTGVVPIFHTNGRPGDFWIAALRTDAREQVVPFDLLTNPAGVPPHGPRHFLTPLTLLEAEPGDVVDDGQVDIVSAPDDRRRIRTITSEAGHTVTVGDGLNSVGDFTSIQDAIDSLPSRGGRVLVRQGLFSEQIEIRRRRNIRIEGCGAGTILETPLTSPTGNLISILDSEGISFSGFELHAIDQVAASVRNVVEVALFDLKIIAGQRVGEDFSPAASSGGLPLFHLFRCAAAQLRGIDAESYQRAVMRAVACELLTLTEINVVGRQQDAVAATRPMFSIEGSALVRMRECVLKTFGQVGIELARDDNQDVELCELEIESSFQQLLTESQARSTVDITGAQVTLKDSVLRIVGDAVSDHPVVVATGADIAITGNRIEVSSEAAKLVWGGVQLRGGCERVTVLNNWIEAGAGHGITLGSALWRPSDSPSPSPRRAPILTARRREGPGRAQFVGFSSAARLSQDLGEGFVDDDGVEYSPVNEGPLVDIVLADNRIQGFANSGISVITVWGYRNLTGEFVEFRRGRIEGNRIINNGVDVASDLPAVRGLPFPSSTEGVALPIQVLPVGGIVLASATEGVEIRNNVIRDNASSNGSVPICGVFVLNGDGIAIDHNRIVNNGDIRIDESLVRGVGAGIVVLFAGTGDATEFDEMSPILSRRRTPPSDGFAVRITQNAVVQPDGRALHLVGSGAMSVVGNALTSRGYLGARTATDRFAVGELVYIQNLGAPWESFNIEALPGAIDPDTTQPVDGFDDYQTPVGTSSYLLDDNPETPHFFAGEGGRLLFNNNHVNLDWNVMFTDSDRAPASFFPVALISMDHVGASGNQIAMRLSGEPSSPPVPPLPDVPNLILGQMMVIGGTLNVNANRLSSGLGDVYVSMLTWGEMMSNVTLNQCTHGLTNFLRADDTGGLREHGNLVLASSDTAALTKQAFSDIFLRLVTLPTGRLRSFNS